MNNSSNELVDELAYSWLEVHKKSALTYLVLIALSEKELWATDIVKWVNEVTDWSINEHALYRVLRRLEHQGVIVFRTEQAKRSGAERKIFATTDDGKELIRQMRGELQYLTEV
jgi:DNA-binding PadR family transcriptional regulator